ncbi:hypothetical protein C1X73_01490 [Pseudomonas sp. FW305-130]|nr:hypothetical protein C1X74_07065 [Pseudomonas sp. GW460-5]PNB63006.1 hypothetical protein C1X73_01490 [Pseudomonas sp. FW305-130]QDY37056.1 hypothetical protein CHR26_12645 [Pseudomonas putida]
MRVILGLCGAFKANRFVENLKVCAITVGAALAANTGRAGAMYRRWQKFFAKPLSCIQTWQAS